MTKKKMKSLFATARLLRCDGCGTARAQRGWGYRSLTRDPLLRRLLCRECNAAVTTAIRVALAKRKKCG